MVYNTQSSNVPTAHVTTHKNRLKNYGEKFYLKDKQNFQIELFNPHNLNVLAKIKINGKLIGSGIIVRPGQRVFLERYLDDAKLFEFQTYEVPKNNAQVESAIRNNGYIEIEFFQEKIFTSYITTTNVYDYNDWNLNLTGTSCYDSNISTLTSGVPAGLSSSISNCSNNVNFCSSAIAPTYPTKETGRIEKGGNSDQRLTETNMDFQSFALSSYTFQLLPESQQISETQNFKIYCEHCGYRVRSKTAKFCSSCGTQIR